METLQFTEKLVIVNCGTCNIRHAIPESLNDRSRNTGAAWYCPNGHFIGYTKTKNQELNEELDRAKRLIGIRDSQLQSKNHQIEHLSYYLRAQKAAKTKIMNRVKNGVCPCCNRTFTDLQNHFKTKHPELL